MSASGLSSRAIMGTFFQRLEAAQGASWVDKIGMYFRSNQESETYKWLGMAPSMTEWIGPRESRGLRENGITIKNKKFQATLSISVDDMRRDKTGQVQVRINDTVGVTVGHWRKLLSPLIRDGGTGVCYDGQYFYDTDHSEADSGTQSNSITVDISAQPATLHGTTTAPSPEEIRAMALKGAETILGFNDDTGEPMNEMARQFLVMVPSAYFSATMAALKSPVLGGDSNVMMSLDGLTFEPVMNSRLATWTDKLVVFRIDGSAKPFILQEEEGVTISALAEGSEVEFNEDEHRYGVKAIRNVGYGYWQHACLVQAV